jgi:hypothetical protein
MYLTRINPFDLVSLLDSAAIIALGKKGCAKRAVAYWAVSDCFSHF